jgi:biotin transport system permease protein
MAGKLRRAARRTLPSPFAYRAGKTFLHRAPAALKLLAVMALSAIAFASVPGLALVILLILTASAAAGIPPWELMKGAKPLLLLSLCIVLLKTFEQGGEGITTPEIIICTIYIPDVYLPNISANGFGDGIIVALRILATFAAAALLFAVTTMREMRLSLSALEIRVKNVFAARRKKKETTPSKDDIAFFSLGISLMLGFIPRFFDLWETANLACEARSCKRGLRRLFMLIPLVCERMMEAAANTALALQARGLNDG